MAKKKSKKKPIPKKHEQTNRKPKNRSASGKTRKQHKKKIARSNSKRKRTPSGKLVRKVTKLVKKKSRSKKPSRKSVKPLRKASKAKQNKSVKTKPSKKKKTFRQSEKHDVGKVKVLRKKIKNAEGNETRFYSNVLFIDLSVTIDVDEKLLLIDTLAQRDIQYYIDKEYPKFPRAYQIILKTSQGDQEFEKANKLSDPEKSVNLDNIISDIKEAIEEFINNFLSILELGDSSQVQTESSWVFDPSNIEGVFVRFFYAQ